jgi:aminopeptidase N
MAAVAFRSFCLLSLVAVAGLSSGCGGSGGSDGSDESGDEPEDAGAEADADAGTAPTGAEAYVEATFDVTVDPDTGAVTGTATATLRSGGEPLAQLDWLLDQGLAATSATVDGVAAAVDGDVVAPYRSIAIAPDSPIPAGATVEVTLHYEGTVACESPAPLQGPCDVVPGGMSRFSPSSIFPGFVTTDQQIQRGPHTVVLRTPAESDVLVSADRTDDRNEAGQRVTTWRVDEALHILPTAIVGTFETVSLTKTPRPVFFHHAAGDDGWVARLREWIPNVAAFVESRIERPLPCRELHLVKWPDSFQDSGYATFCLIGLRDLHEQTGDLLFEESWAHEIAHIFWGISVLPRDKATEKVLTEGLATYTMWDYRFAQDGEGIDRDEYLASRDREAGLMLRYATPVAASTPVVVASPDAAVDLAAHGFQESFTWEYVKTTATLDLLELLVGREAFGKGVTAYHDACQWRGCSIEDFQTAIETSADRDLERFFAEWFRASPFPTITVEFVSTSGVVDVTLSTDSPVATPLELWIELDDGQRVRERVTVTRPATQASIAVDGTVRAVRPNPRHDALAFISSEVFGDIDFDGAVTAADRDRCAALDGKIVEPRFPPGGGEAYMGVDLDFDPRCDLDGNAIIDAADLAAIPVP